MPEQIAAVFPPIACHSGAPRSGEPGIHEHRPLEYGFRVPKLRSGPGMTAFTA
jgi:hypothetical protein